MEFITSVNIVIASAGIVFNLSNITVFLLQDWRTNNVTLTLLALSVADLMTLVSVLVLNLFSILQTLLPKDTFDYLAVQYYIVGWSMAMFSDISSLTTVLVSLERCLCIIMPLHVQSLFSVKRSLIALATVWALVGLSYTVVFSTTTLCWSYDLHFNITRLIVLISKERMKVETGHNISNAIILPSFCELAVLINTVVMVIGLKRSSQFQKKSTHISSNHQRNLASSQKYTRLVIVVCCISAIFIACNTPIVLIVYCKYFVPGFSYSGVHRELFMTSVSALILFYSVNASVNFFVYVSLNHRFRNKLREIVQCTDSKLRSPKLS